MGTTIAIAILAAALAFPAMTTVAFAQSSNDFQEFMECLFDDVGGSSATAQDVEAVLQGNSADVTEQKIRDCFSPIYNDGSGSTSSSNNSDDDEDSNPDDNDDSTGTSNNNNSDDAEEDGTEGNTEGDDTTDETDGTGTGGNEDTTGGNTDDTDSADDGTENNTQ